MLYFNMYNHGSELTTNSYEYCKGIRGYSVRTIPQQMFIPCTSSHNWNHFYMFSGYFYYGSFKILGTILNVKEMYYPYKWTITVLSPWQSTFINTLYIVLHYFALFTVLLFRGSALFVTPHWRRPRRRTTIINKTETFLRIISN